GAGPSAPAAEPAKMSAATDAAATSAFFLVATILQCRLSGRSGRVPSYRQPAPTTRHCRSPRTGARGAAYSQLRLSLIWASGASKTTSTKYFAPRLGFLTVSMLRKFPSWDRWSGTRQRLTEYPKPG